MNRQRVILPHSSTLNKVPMVDDALIGELYVNGASGDGTSMLITLKADNTLATFHEDEYWAEELDAIEEKYDTEISGIQVDIETKFINVIHTDDVGVLSAVTPECEVMIKDDTGYKKTKVDTFVEYIDETLATLKFEYDEDTNRLNITGNKSNMTFDPDTEILNITL